MYLISHAAGNFFSEIAQNVKTDLFFCGLQWAVRPFWNVANRFFLFYGSQGCFYN